MTPCYFFCQPLCLTKGGSSASKQDFICRGVFCPENDDGPFWLFSFKASLEVVSVSRPSKTVKRFGFTASKNSKWGKSSSFLNFNIYFRLEKKGLTFISLSVVLQFLLAVVVALRTSKSSFWVLPHPEPWSSVLPSAGCCAHFFSSVLQLKQFRAPSCSLYTPFLLLCGRSDWSMMWACFVTKSGGQIRPCRACSLGCCCCTVILHAAVGGEVANAFSWLLCQRSCSEGTWECQQQKEGR